MSGWELRETMHESDEPDASMDDAELCLKERLRIEDQQGAEFCRIHDGTHPDVAAYLAARTLALAHAANSGVAKKLVTLFEPENPQLSHAASPSKLPSPPRALSNKHAKTEKAVLQAHPLAGPVVSGVFEDPVSSMPQDGLDVGPIRRSDRQSGPGFYAHRMEEDARLDKLTTSAKKKQAALVLPAAEQTEQEQGQAVGAVVRSPHEPISAEIAPGVGVLGVPATAVLPRHDANDPTAGPIRRSDRQPGPGFHAHRKDEDARLGNLTSPPKKTKTALVLPAVEKTEDEPSQAAGALVRSPVALVGEGAPRYPVRQAGMGFYAFQQAENARVNQPKKRPQGDGEGPPP